jgi:hypothetical protein
METQRVLKNGVQLTWPVPGTPEFESSGELTPEEIKLRAEELLASVPEGAAVVPLAMRGGLHDDSHFECNGLVRVTVAFDIVRYRLLRRLDVCYAEREKVRP